MKAINKLSVLSFLILSSLLFLSGCGSNTGDSDTEPTSNTTVARAQDDLASPANASSAAINEPTKLYVQFGADFLSVPRERILGLLEQVSQFELVLLEDDSTSLSAGRHLLFGNSVIGQQQWPNAKASLTQGESYFIKSAALNEQTHLVWASGIPAQEKALLENINAGDLYAAYDLLERIGFSFLHPLEPTLPSSLDLELSEDVIEAPRWPIRAWHLHTQHPLELTHVLNGWGSAGPDDLESWQELLVEWERFLEWSIANKQNRVEWFLLMAESWQEFADSEERQRRLRILVDMAHSWGLAVGIDAPIAFKQQHAWTMLREKGNELEQIRSAIDWLNEAGFDYFEIEAGFSEFTHPSDEDMVAWMNEVAIYSDEKYGKPTYVKVHCTQSQYAKTYVDPENGEPLNFNFLPYYTDSRMGVLPHTVQYYDLEGPAYTYDNETFNFMRRYMQMEAGRREVLYYPETAYWVSFDIDVPLFLPIYMDRRLYDLRLIAQDEDAGRMGRGELQGSRIQGQVNFSSGWEWGYWMNDVVTARAAWTPNHEIEHAQALSIALDPIVAPFGEQSNAVKNSLLTWIDLQNRLFLFGEVDGEEPEQLELLNAQAYLQGWEAWDDMNKTLGILETQPRKMGMLDMLNPLAPAKHKVDYQQQLQPLLSATAKELRNAYEEYVALMPAIPSTGLPLFNEIKDSMEMTVLRAEQVFQLYETAASIHPIILNADKTQANIHLNKARAALDRATEVVAQREQSYRADPERIAGWNYNPTAYHFNYLWSVRSLHYWWRDEGKIVDRPFSPGYLNIMDPIDIANGEGEWVEWVFNLSSLRDWVADATGQSGPLAEILYEPEEEPTYPQDNLRDRPYWFVPIQ
ncbi:MAG: hypothetical protein MI867_09780 [Pseudomonadales bacterium]|nr:hypothetical protein [Pseudomonadales bacterium]